MVVISVSATYWKYGSRWRLCEQVRKNICNEPLQTPVTDDAHAVLGNRPQSFSAWKSCILKTFPCKLMQHGECVWLDVPIIYLFFQRWQPSHVDWWLNADGRICCQSSALGPQTVNDKAGIHPICAEDHLSRRQTYQNKEPKGQWQPLEIFFVFKLDTILLKYLNWK